MNLIKIKTTSLKAARDHMRILRRYDNKGAYINNFRSFRGSVINADAIENELVIKTDYYSESEVLGFFDVVPSREGISKAIEGISYELAKTFNSLGDAKEYCREHNGRTHYYYSKLTTEKTRGNFGVYREVVVCR